MSNPYKPGGPLLPPKPLPPKELTPRKQSIFASQRRRPCTGSRKTCRRRELRRRAKLRKHRTVKNNNSIHTPKSNTGSSGSIADKHDYIERLRQNLQDEIDMLYNAGMNDEAKKKEELLATIRY